MLAACHVLYELAFASNLTDILNFLLLPARDTGEDYGVLRLVVKMHVYMAHFLPFIS